MIINRARDLFVVSSFVVCSVFLVTAGAGYGQVKTQAAGGMAGMTNMSREEQIESHGKMIGIHTKVIECLKSNKPVSDCNQEMMQACATMHGGSCPMGGMMGMMGGGQGMMGKGKAAHGNMMNQDAASGETAPNTGAPKSQPKK